jgi:transposase
MGAGNNVTGWIARTFKHWKGTSKEEDYHGNMDSNSFQKWVIEYMELAAARSVLVIDRAPYHVQLTDDTRRAVTSMSRPQLAQWLLDHHVLDDNGVPYSREILLTVPGVTPTGRKLQGMTKAALLALCRENDPKPVYKVQAWFDKFNNENPGKDLKVLILPVAHPQLNPIENLWGQMKQHVRKYNFKFTMAKIEELFLEKFKKQTADDWNKQYQKMLRYAKEQWEADEKLLNEAENEEMDDLEPMDEGE